QHLLYLAQKYGASTQRGDGVLFVEAPLPAPPRTRPWVLAGVGVAVLLIAVAVLGPAGGPERGGQRTEGRGQRTEDKRPGQSNGNGQEAKGDGQGAAPSSAEAKAGKAEPKAAPVVYTVGSARELADVLEKQPSAVIRLTDDLDLTSRDDTFTVAGDVTLEAAPGKRPVVRLAYDPSPRAEPWAVFTVRSGHLKVSGLRFEVDATEAPDLDMSALAVHAGRLTVENCVFVQLRPPSGGPGSLSAVAVLGHRRSAIGDRPSATGREPV